MSAVCKTVLAANVCISAIAGAMRFLFAKIITII